MMTLDELDARTAILALKIQHTDPYDYHTMRENIAEIEELKTAFNTLSGETND